MPQLFKEEDVFGWNFHLPFDPHDIKYFEDGREIMAEMRKADVPEDVKKLVTHETDIRYILDMYDGEIVRDYEGRPSIKGEREAKVTLVYFYTNKWMKGCAYYDELALHRR
jgi:hypothetical protein